MIAKVLGAVAAAACAATALPSVPADAAATARVRIVDRYHHGRVRVVVDGVSRKVGYGDRTKFFSVTPVAAGNDGVSVTSLRYAGCGTGDVANYFDGGHSYRVVVYHLAGIRCQLSDGNWVAGPTFKVVKLS